MILRFHLLLSALLALSRGELLMVLALWRHGDRAPDGLPYPLDQNGEERWPRGWNQLTNLGIEQTYELGTFLRQRYIGTLLKENFDRKQVFIRSSDSERALQSAQAVMAGMYPPTDQMIWNNSLLWQPIPIHSNGFGRPDLLLKPTSVDCPGYDLIKEEENRDLEAEINVKYADLFKLLTNYTGMAVSYRTVKGLSDIDKEQIHNLPQPSWVSESWNGQPIMDHILELKRLIRNAEFNSPRKARLRGGFLLNDWLDHLKKVRAGKKHFKAALYSSHDGTVSAVTNVMGITNNQSVPYAACVLTELHSSESGNLHIKVFYRNGTSAESLNQMLIPGCTMDCPLEEAIKLLEPQTLKSEEQFHELCASSSSVCFFAITLAVLLQMLSS